jgi:hypothetical protein
MKVDAKIVNQKLKTGLFSSKTLPHLQFTITLTDIERAIIDKHGLHEVPFLTLDLDPAEAKVWGSPTRDLIIGKSQRLTIPGNWAFNTLAEAQIALMDLKKGLTKLKDVIENAQHAPTEESFEL